MSFRRGPRTNALFYLAGLTLFLALSGLLTDLLLLVRTAGSAELLNEAISQTFLSYERLIPVFGTALCFVAIGWCLLWQIDEKAGGSPGSLRITSSLLVLIAYSLVLLLHLALASIYVSLGIEPTLTLGVYFVRHFGELASTFKGAVPTVAPVLLIHTAVFWLIGFALYRRYERLQPALEAPQPVASDASPRTFRVSRRTAWLIASVILGGRLFLEVELGRELLYSYREHRQTRAARTAVPAQRGLPDLPARHAFEPRKFDSAHLGPDAPSRIENVFVFVMEGVRADSFDFQKSRAFGPKQDVLQVDRFFVPTPHSSTSLFSLLTGNYAPTDVFARFDEQNLSASLPELLARRGFARYFVSGGDANFEKMSLLLGKLKVTVVDQTKLKPFAGHAEYRRFAWGLEEDALADQAARLLRSEESRLFVVFAFTNTHSPYFNAYPERYDYWNNATQLGRYLNAVDYTGDVIDRIVADAERTRPAKNLFVLLSDHGESFGEHGYRFHDFSLFNPEVRVPFALRFPGARASGRGRQIPTGSLLDVAPTILHLLGIAHPAMHGRSLMASGYSLNLLLRPWGGQRQIGLLHKQHKWLCDVGGVPLRVLTLDDEPIHGLPFDEPATRFVDELRSLRFRVPHAR